MDEFSRIIRWEPLAVPTPRSLADHHVEGRPVLPAVIALEVLAGRVREAFPGADVFCQQRIAFDKFLFLDPSADHIHAECGLHRTDNGVAAVLRTRTRLSGSGITRIKIHAAAVFGQGGDAPPPVPAEGRFECAGEVPPERVYRDLVPFGPAFQNLAGPVRLSQEGARAEVSSPAADGPGFILGSPYPLDAAFHTACVWGQSRFGFTAFPVAIGWRSIVSPMEPGETYVAHVTPGAPEGNGFFTDIRIEDGSGRVMEALSGVYMRDVTGGRMKPPDWIRELNRETGRA